MKIIARILLWLTLATSFQSLAIGSPSLSLSTYNMYRGNTVTLSWSRPSGTQYFNLWVLKPGDSWLKFRGGYSSTSFNRYINKNGTHTFYVEACDASGCSASGSASVTVSEPPPPGPSTVRGFSLSTSHIYTGGSVMLNWQPPNSYSGSLYYRLRTKKPGGDWFVFRDVSTTGFLRSGINLAGTHYYQIQACDSWGQCSYSSTLSLRVSSPPPVPNAVTGLTASKTQLNYGDSVKVSWSKPGNISDTTYYDVYITKPGAQPGLPDEHFLWHDNYSATELTRNEVYRRGTTKIGVVPCNVLNQCGPLREVSFTVGGTLPQPTFTRNNPVIRQGEQVTFNWSLHPYYKDAVNYTLYQHAHRVTRKIAGPLADTEQSFTHTLTEVGISTFYLEMCNTYGECNDKSRTALNVQATPVISLAAVDQLTVNKANITYGEHVSISWQRPKGYTETDGLVYDVYVTKPSPNPGEADIRFLWRDNHPGLILTRGPNYRRGTIKIEVVPCLAGQCGQSRAVSYTLSGDTLPAATQFKVKQSSVFAGNGFDFSWQFPEFFQEAVTTQLWVKAPGATTLSEYHSNAPLYAPGQYTFYLQYCDQKAPAICNDHLSQPVTATVKSIKVANLSVDKSHINYGDSVTISWQKPQGYSGTLTYDVYITKPSSEPGQPAQRFLWQRALTETQIIRGPNYRRGQIGVEVHPCLSDGTCGEVATTQYTLDGSVLPDAVQFASEKPEYYLNEPVSFSWKMPEFFKEPVSAKLWVKAPDSQTIREFIPGTGLNQKGTYTFYLQTCLTNFSDVCSRQRSAAASVVVSDNVALLSVEGLSVSSTEITYGDSVTLSWRKPAIYPQDMIYDVYITKPSQYADEPEQRFLWQDNYAGTSLQRGPNFRRGTIKVEVQPCTLSGQCGQLAEVAYQLTDPHLPAVVFKPLPERVFTHQTVTLQWQVHEFFQEHVSYSLYVKAPDQPLSLLAELDSRTDQPRFQYQFKDAGEYTFSVQACDLKTGSTVCSQLESSEMVASVEPLNLTLSAENGKLLWTNIAQIDRYMLEMADCTQGCTSDRPLNWQNIPLSGTDTDYDVTAMTGLRAYRVKACFSDTICSGWSNQVLHDPGARLLTSKIADLRIIAAQIRVRLKGDRCKNAANGQFWTMDLRAPAGIVSYNMLKTAYERDLALTLSVPTCQAGIDQPIIDLYQDYR
ncbi:chitinase N-terminal domain-containing protein [Pseudoalteromonas rubra]|uniref:chitinase N-terminal domain-containing protein n=1 Tax=Pseudoalteromonas rubra TaxID=43658 RepID=UPI000F7852E9|nr:chitinase N-terminal domain-containing protein [Pseudoalteromonas rubra]